MPSAIARAQLGVLPRRSAAGGQIELIRRDYVANGGWETFLSYEDPHRDILVGLLRLRKCGENTYRPELKGQCSIVRELHVYVSVRCTAAGGGDGRPNGPRPRRAKVGGR